MAIAVIAHNIRVERTYRVMLNTQCRFGDDDALYVEQEHLWGDDANVPATPNTT